MGSSTFLEAGKQDISRVASLNKATLSQSSYYVLQPRAWAVYWPDCPTFQGRNVDLWPSWTQKVEQEKDKTKSSPGWEVSRAEIRTVLELKISALSLLNPMEVQKNLKVEVEMRRRRL
jgi:hypothetical protein